MYFPDNRTMEVDISKVTLDTLLHVLASYYGNACVSDMRESITEEYIKYPFLYFRRDNIYLGVNKVSMRDRSDRYFDGTPQFNISKTTILLRKVNRCLTQ